MRYLKANGIQVELSEEQSRQLYSEIYRLFDKAGNGAASVERRDAFPIINGMFDDLYEMGLT